LKKNWKLNYVQGCHADGQGLMNKDVDIDADDGRWRVLNFEALQRPRVKNTKVNQLRGKFAVQTHTSV
jgi:hypothetical protein